MRRIGKVFAVMVLFVWLVSLAGCGGGTEVKSTTTTTTLGQELQDLDAAHEKGIINDKEYEKAKKDILKRYDR